MKITIAYLPEEEHAAAEDAALLLRRHPSGKLRRAASHDPWIQLYIRTPLICAADGDSSPTASQQTAKEPAERLT